MTDLTWLDEWVDAHADELIAFRRHLHAHPELSFEESATTELIAGRLEAAGLTTRPLRIGTGLLCDIGTAPIGPDTRTVALRADIDALAMDDEKDVHYRSRVDGVAHACGHDVHTTVVLGAGLALAQGLERAGVDGRVRLIFQPAEERVPGGALQVIDEGGLDGVTEIFGVHCDPKLEVGQVGVRAGAITSAADMMTVTLHGPGGHTARPELTVDLVRVAAMVATDLPNAVRARARGAAPLTIVFGSMRAGEAGNVIPSRAVLRGTVRTTDREVWTDADVVVADALRDLVEPTGAVVELEYTRGIPPVVNDRHATELLAAAAASVLGADAVQPTVQSAGGDDFAWFAEQVPGSYARLGTHGPTWEGPRLDLHASHFDVDEDAIAVGVRLLVATVLRALDDGR